MTGGQLLGGYPIYKAVDNPGLLEAAHRNNPNAVMIYRHWYPDYDQTARLNEMATVGIEIAFNRWFSENEVFLRAMPYAYHESYNEIDAPDQYLAFEKYRIEKLADRGYKACVINIASAHSDEAMWRRAAPMVDAAIKHGAIIGEHSYAQTVMSANVNDSYWTKEGDWHGELFPTTIIPESCHTALRILRSKKILAAQGQGAAVLVATELGWDNVLSVYAPSGTRTEGFHDCVPIWQRLGWIAPGDTPLGFAMRQLNWWAKMTNCLGVIYTVGNSGNARWNNFDITGLM